MIPQSVDRLLMHRVYVALGSVRISRASCGHSLPGLLGVRSYTKMPFMGQTNIDAVHLNRLLDHYAKHGALPSYAWMGEMLGFKGKSAAAKLADCLESAGFLRSAPGGKKVPTTRFFEIPLFDTRVRAGLADAIEGQTVTDSTTIEGFLIESPSSTVLIRVKGESMMDAGIFDGDLAVVDRGLRGTTGAFVVAIVDGDSHSKSCVLKAIPPS